MAKARHAQRSRRPLVVGVLIAAVVVAGALALFLTQRHSGETATPQPGAQSGGTGATDSPSSADRTAAASAGPSSGGTSATAHSSSDVDTSDTAALTGCRGRVAAGDAVLAAAATAHKHWSEHVRAQTSADHGSISLDEMKAMWKHTKLAGPSDVRRYRAAVHRAGAGSSCRSTSSSSVSGRLARCQQRLDAQGPMRKAAQEVVDDWSSHLSDMRRSAAGTVPGVRAQQIWLDTWRHAPKDLNAYTKAEHTYQKAPTCA